MKLKLTEKELEILQVLWEKGPSTVREVHDILSQSSEAGYTTTLKLMQIMFEKKELLSRKKSGKTHIYTSLMPQKEAQKDLLGKMIDRVFGGSTQSLVMEALGNSKSSEEDLQQIRDFLDELERK